MNKFTPEQQALIAAGAESVGNLRNWVRSFAQVTNKKVIVKRHWYITSSPGLGKTYTVYDTFKSIGITPVKIEGKISLPAFTRKMAYAVYHHNILQGKEDQPLFVVVDDCDALFANHDGLNVMKGILDLTRESLSYEVDMTGQIRSYRKSDSTITQTMADAIEEYQTDGGLGITIPMHNVCFIFLTNQELTAANDVKLAKMSKKMKLIATDESACRNRLEYKEIPDEGMNLWGYNANLVLNSNILGDEHTLTTEQKHTLLQWMYTNWDNLPSASIRDAMDLAAAMINSPDDYISEWNQRLV